MKVFKALTIAGSDSGGGAGIQADLKTFQELGVFGMSAITAVTVQNTLGVRQVYPLPPQAVTEQMETLADDMGVDALKTGMLFSAELIQLVSRKIRDLGWKRLVVDPVMVAKGGAKLLQDDAVVALRKELIPLAAIVTPNMPEAEVLCDMPVRTPEDQRKAAEMIIGMGARTVVVKGGHAEGEQSVDIFYDGKRFVELVGRRVVTRHTHGTGCTFAAAATAAMATGATEEEAVRTAKAFIQAALETELDIGARGHGPTNHWAYRRAAENNSAEHNTGQLHAAANSASELQTDVTVTANSEPMSGGGV